MSARRRLAAVDIGTVTTRLLVADVTPGDVTEVARRTDITHLGEDLTRTGTLSPSAMRRVADVVGGYVEIAAELGVDEMTAIATSAARDAGNATEFVGMLEARGLRPTVIDGQREAYLSFLGATYGLDDGPVLVDDIGGGSTELVFGWPATGGAAGPVIEAARSFDVGSRRLTEMFLHSDPPTARELSAARAHMAEEMRQYFDALRERPRTVVSVAGTATSLVAVSMAMEVYEPEVVHGSTLAGSEVSDLLEMLASVTLEERRSVVGLHPERAGVIIAGALVLETALGLAGVDSTRVSEHDILYGILLDAVATDASGEPSDTGYER